MLPSLFVAALQWFRIMSPSLEALVVLEGQLDVLQSYQQAGYANMLPVYYPFLNKYH